VHTRKEGRKEERKNESEGEKHLGCCLETRIIITKRRGGERETTDG